MVGMQKVRIEMQIVIDIPLEWLLDMKNKKFCQTDSLYQKILNGTPLPKEHGRLIDADEVVKDICIEYKANSIYELSDELRSFIKKYLNEASTILKPTIKYMIKNYAFSESEE